VFITSCDSYTDAAPLGNFGSPYTAVGSTGSSDKTRNKDESSFFCWRLWMISMASLRIEYRLLFIGLTVSQSSSF
jgi:hypothetical protein